MIVGIVVFVHSTVSMAVVRLYRWRWCDICETPTHYRQAHQTPFKRYSRGGSVWYSHKTAGGKWCKEK
jgi:hypothetical protein